MGNLDSARQPVGRRAGRAELGNQLRASCATPRPARKARSSGEIDCKATEITLNHPLKPVSLQVISLTRRTPSKTGRSTIPVTGLSWPSISRSGAARRCRKRLCSCCRSRPCHPTRRASRRCHRRRRRRCCRRWQPDRRGHRARPCRTSRSGAGSAGPGLGVVHILGHRGSAKLSARPRV